jgi:prefoldin subunit 5
MIAVQSMETIVDQLVRRFGGSARHVDEALDALNSREDTIVQNITEALVANGRATEEEIEQYLPQVGLSGGKALANSRRRRELEAQLAEIDSRVSAIRSELASL